ncbi:MAG TPA: hypothetical protein VE969_01910 [Pyrinomonadaceae bacterium]|jgi:hypothetical protein|nr:hypothetical protein [Pyrinomonadaceae bacterium]
MSKHKITSTIEGDLFSRLLLLEGETIDLHNDGAGTFSSTNTIEVIGGLNIAVIVRGLVGAEWKLKISEGDNDLVSETRTIEMGNRDSFAKTVILGDTNDDAEAAAATGGAKKAGKKGGN